MEPEMIWLLELRGKVHVGLRGLLTMLRCLLLIKSSWTIAQRANPWCAIPPTLQQLIRLNKPQAKLLDHISKLQWRSVKWLRLRKIAGIYNEVRRISPYVAMFGTGRSLDEPEGIKMRLEKKDYQLPITTGRSPLPSKSNINFDSWLCLKSKTAMVQNLLKKGFVFPAEVLEILSSKRCAANNFCSQWKRMCPWSVSWSNWWFWAQNKPQGAWTRSGKLSLR